MKNNYTTYQNTHPPPGEYLCTVRFYNCTDYLPLTYDGSRWMRYGIDCSKEGEIIDWVTVPEGYPGRGF
jgi:hypothetical protein